MIKLNPKKKSKLLDIFNLLLLGSLSFLTVLTFRPNLPKLQNYIPQILIQETPSPWGRNREFPPDFTEEEKIILTEQLHDYERTTPEMDAAYERFRELLKTYVSYDPNLTVIMHKGDCFVRPVILVVREGQAVTIKNNNPVGVNMGVGGEDWHVPAFGEITVYPKLIQEVKNQTVWGYACGNKGMGGYFVRAN